MKDVGKMVPPARNVTGFLGVIIIHLFHNGRQFNIYFLCASQ